ncbi:MULTISPECIES: ATP12 family chaperone protein [unclassified Mesorhizobium]|uniref:ATP12 family chaperone protein n=2 Tax=Mesorhizobium TaxID=68287 RepID=UPI000FCAA821|nr:MULTISPECIES: ATP12 family chaperone protein [unclassified Mesorhizobium]RVD19770.1 ATPase [Mesorhizobium sp. M4B.F.Ca.ET.017.02.2.1]RVD45596.1 ATPase [Mesorhizobium sp. M4B.F.Ca.ET.019.03.1.1]TGQ08247.1 ATPase [Mesorhizobium sp. M4B.F.Ca.ET.215.01.1.1]TGQ32836.1 ATPase [Mesorhizobium sp. M4B.F.Ca.ET.214.01.1.1]TGQ36040.1 ATPase [Mesorhizobium sp. M00.F.Ca.ET.220.01.1.1]
MRDILNDLEAGKQLSDPDPVRRAQIQMKTPLPKRFYKTVSLAPVEEGFAVHLDGRPVRTPGKTLLALPTEKAAALVAGEFDAQGEVIDPVTMPVMRLVNTAIDGVASDPQAVLEDILRFASSDLLCYRADGPQGLVDRQNQLWDPVIDWARGALGARFLLAEGIVHVEQPRETIAVLGAHLAQRNEPLRLAAIHVMTSLTGSALLAMAVDFGELDGETAWAAAHVDEDWQIEHWGQDAEAVARRSARKRDMLAAIGLLEALKA